MEPRRFFMLSFKNEPRDISTKDTVRYANEIENTADCWCFVEQIVIICTARAESPASCQVFSNVMQIPAIRSQQSTYVVVAESLRLLRIVCSPFSY